MSPQSPTPSDAPEIHHDGDMRRFATTVDGAKAYLDYRQADGVMSITHTWVPAEIGGRGIAGQLVRAALEHARASGLKVEPACSYAAGWIQRHPEYADLVA